MSQQKETSNFHFAAEFRRESSIQVREVPFPPNPPSAASFKKSWDMMRRNWINGGLKFVSFFNDPMRGKALRENLDWSLDSFDLTVREVGELIQLRQERMKATRTALSVGELIKPPVGLWRFSQTELLQLMVGAFAIFEANNPYRLALMKIDEKDESEL